MLTVEVAASYPEDKFSTGPRRPKQVVDMEKVIEILLQLKRSAQLMKSQWGFTYVDLFGWVTHSSSVLTTSPHHKIQL